MRNREREKNGKREREMSSTITAAYTRQFLASTQRHAIQTLWDVAGHLTVYKATGPNRGLYFCSLIVLALSNSLMLSSLLCRWFPGPNQTQNNLDFELSEARQS